MFIYLIILQARMGLRNSDSELYLFLRKRGAKILMNLKLTKSILFKMFIYLIIFSDETQTFFFDKKQALEFIKNKSNIISFTEMDVQDARITEYRVKYNQVD